MTGDLSEGDALSNDRWVRTQTGDTGHAVYGPYAATPPGIYKVDFELALDGTARLSGDPVCAVIDVAANSGNAVLARAEVRASQLSEQPATFQLEASLWEPRVLEYRVATTGAAAMRVGAEPRAARIGDPPSAQPPSDPCADTFDPIELNGKIRTILRLLQPSKVRDIPKVRLGNLGDGGYVCIDDFRSGDIAFSFGINDDITWDVDAADRGLQVYQYDHTVEDPAPHDARMVFEKKMIGPVSSEKVQSLADLIRRHDRKEQRPNLVLKMDIECHEWDVFNSTDPHLISRFSQIVCELHYFQSLNRMDWRRKIFAALNKLHNHYAVVHVHGNVTGDTSIISGVFIPNVIEVTFANRALYRFEETSETFPGPLDFSCQADRPDIWLGNFRY